MTKERLRDDNIICDLLRWEKNRLSSSGDHALSFVIPVALLGIVLWIVFHWAAGVVLLCAAAALTVPYILRLRASRQRQALIRKGGFSVTEQTLLNITSETVTDPHTSFGRTKILREAEFLCFGTGEWRIPERNYSWSELYAMSREGVKNTSLIGDTFYTVTVDGCGEIAAVYSAKLFERKTKK